MTTYLDRPFFAFPPDWRDLEQRPLDDFSYTDRSGSGVGTPWQTSDHYRRQLFLPFLADGHEAVAWIREFHRARRGMAHGFWVPAWVNEFRLLEDAQVGATEIVVERTRLQEAVSLVQHGYVALIEGWGATGVAQPRAISAVTVDGSSEIVELSEELDVAAFRGRTRCCPLLYVRFSDDALEFEYLTDNCIRTRIGFTELPDEYPLASGPKDATEEIWLYHFRLGNTSARYAAWGAPVIAAGMDWTPADIGHDQIVEDVELSDEVTINLASDDPVHFLRRRHLQPLHLDIYALVDGEATLRYAGEVSQVDSEDRGGLRVRCTGRAGWDRQVPAVMYQRLDNHALFSEGNGLSPADWTVTGEVAAIGSRYVESAIVSATISDKEDAEWFLFGFVRIGDERRVVVGIDGDRLYLSDSFEAAEVGDEIAVTAGYDRRIQTAAARFGNEANFLGFPYMTSEHPAVEQLGQAGSGGGKKG